MLEDNLVNAQKIFSFALHYLDRYRHRNKILWCATY